MNLIRKLIDIIQKLKYVMNKKQKRTALVLVGIVLVGSIFETLGVSVIVPFIESIIMPEELLENKLITSVMKALSINDENVIWVVAFMIIFIYVSKNIILLISSYAQISFRCNLVKDVSVKMLKAYLNHPYTYFFNINSGKVIRGIYDDVLGLYFILEDLFKGMAELLTAVFIGVALFIIDPMLALGMLVLAGIVLLFVFLVIKKRVGRLGEQLREIVANLHQYVLQAVGAIKEIIVCSNRDYFVNEYSESFDKRRKVEIEYSFIGSCPERIVETVCICGLIIMVTLRVDLGVDTVSFISKMGAFAVAAFRILPSMSRLAGYVNNLVYYIPMLDATYENVKEATDYLEIRESRTNERTQKEQDVELKNTLEVVNVSWNYGEKEILKDINLKIDKGESIALIGASGAGKTTLADIILGVLVPEVGDIKLDDRSIYNKCIDWSKIVAYVPQSVYLLDATVRENVAFGISKEKIDDELLWDVLEQAQLKSFVMSLPDGLETIVGERGIKFSGGQKQRLAIARALYRRPQILVLDEATAALDEETEKAVMESIEALQGKMTMIIVAHRLSTIKKCDKIYEVCDKDLIERKKAEIV